MIWRPSECSVSWSSNWARVIGSQRWLIGQFAASGRLSQCGTSPQDGTIFISKVRLHQVSAEIMQWSAALMWTVAGVLALQLGRLRSVQGQTFNQVLPKNQGEVSNTICHYFNQTMCIFCGLCRALFVTLVRYLHRLIMSCRLPMVWAYTSRNNAF